MDHHNPIILVIFIVTYVGIAVGHFPGLKLNRVGIALLGAIAMMLFAEVAIKDVGSYINCCKTCCNLPSFGPTRKPSLLIHICCSFMIQPLTK